MSHQIEHKQCHTQKQCHRVRYLKYRIAGMFGGVNVWQIVGLKIIGKIKFLCITEDSSNSPNFPAAKHSRYIWYLVNKPHGALSNNPKV